MTENYRKCQKLPKITENDRKLPKSTKITENDRKSPKITENRTCHGKKLIIRFSVLPASFQIKTPGANLKCPNGVLGRFERRSRNCNTVEVRALNKCWPFSKFEIKLGI